MGKGKNILTSDMEVMRQMFRLRLKALAGQQGTDDPEIAQFASPRSPQDPYGKFLQARQLSFPERTVLLLALIPHMQPDFFDTLILEFFPQGAELPALGGIRGSRHRGMIPTGETALFMLAGNDPDQRSCILRLFSRDHFFATDNVLYLEAARDHEPPASGRILLSDAYEEYFLTGKTSGPEFGTDFPAKRLTTAMGWEDVVLPEHTLEQIDNVRRWCAWNGELMQDANLGRRLMPGYRVLFHGPPGTGKTLTATLLGKHIGKPVYRIDLSQVVSKYIGETEKNLEKVFNRSQHRDWILFFDEADALFGKRSNIQSSHDRYANQEIAYLLQRITDYPGLIILASNYKNNIDAAFTRRFNTVVHFPLPDARQRLLLWQKAIPANLTLGFDLAEVADRYEITGAGIVNVIHYATLKAMAAGQKCIQLVDIRRGIQEEFHKEDKFF